MTENTSNSDTFPHRYFRVETSGSVLMQLVKNREEQHDYARELVTGFINGAFLHISPANQQQTEALRNAAIISDHKSILIDLVTRDGASEKAWKKTVVTVIHEMNEVGAFGDVDHNEDSIFLEVTPMDALLNLFSSFNVEGEISLIMVGDEDSPEVLYQPNEYERPLEI